MCRVHVRQREAGFVKTLAVDDLRNKTYAEWSCRRQGVLGADPPSLVAENVRLVVGKILPNEVHLVVDKQGHACKWRVSANAEMLLEFVLDMLACIRLGYGCQDLLHLAVVEHETKGLACSHEREEHRLLAESLKLTLLQARECPSSGVKLVQRHRAHQTCEQLAKQNSAVFPEIHLELNKPHPHVPRVAKPQMAQSFLLDMCPCVDDEEVHLADKQRQLSGLGGVSVVLP